MEKIKSFNKGYWIFVGVIFVPLSVYTTFNLNRLPRESSDQKDTITVYEHPDNKSERLDEIPKTTNYKIIKDTKYFHYITYQDSLKGYILK